MGGESGSIRKACCGVSVIKEAIITGLSLVEPYCRLSACALNMDDSIHLHPNCAHNGVLTRVEKLGPMGAPFQTQTSSFSKATAWEA